MAEPEDKPKFPAGLRVLVVDDDPLCLRIVDKMLRRCQYEGAMARRNYFAGDFACDPTRGTRRGGDPLALLATHREGPDVCRHRPASSRRHFPTASRRAPQERSLLRIIPDENNPFPPRTPVTTFTRGAEALKTLRERRDDFDIVLSDVHMPDMDGFKLLEHIALELDVPVMGACPPSPETSGYLEIFPQPRPARRDPPALFPRPSLA